jgi:hypothetical protein
MGFVNKEVNLLRDPFAANAKQPQLPWREKVHWARLQGITRQVNLLCIIKRIVHGDRAAAGSALLQLRDGQVFGGLLRLLHQLFVECSFFSNSGQVTLHLAELCTEMKITVKITAIIQCGSTCTFFLPLTDSHFDKSVACFAGIPSTDPSLGGRLVHAVLAASRVRRSSIFQPCADLEGKRFMRLYSHAKNYIYHL